MGEVKQRRETEEDMPNTIFVVEDDDNIGAFVLQALLQETSYQVVLFTDGYQALDAVQNRKIKPCLFITDYLLPYMNGLELYDKLHAKKELANIPAIIMSAYLPEQEVQKRQLASLHKPFELDDLLNTVERLLP